MDQIPTDQSFNLLKLLPSFYLYEEDSDNMATTLL